MEKRKNDRIGTRALYIMMLLVTAISGLSVSSLGPDTAYAAETAPAGYYGMYFTAFGSDETAECVDMRVAVFDEDGVTLGEFVMSSQDFGDPDDAWETKYVEAYFERPPATIDISCDYKNKLAGDEDFGRMSYRTQFKETDGEVTAADELTGFEFCSYSITHISDDETLHYVDANGNDHVQDEYIVVNEPEIGEKGKETWYALRYEIDTQMVTVSGNVNLVLCDSHSLKSDGGIVIEPGSSLTIWGQKNGTGTIKAIGEDVETDIFSYAAGAPGIEVGRSSSLTINGGTIIAQAGRYSAGIGSRGDDTSGSITINGGKVTATGGSCKEIDGPWDEISEESQRSGAGIGGGAGGSNGPIVITGGEVIAKAGEKGTGGAGIGSGTGASSGPITITGGYVKAEGKNYGAGIGSGARAPSGAIIIDSKGTVDAESVAGAGIGSGGRRYENDSNNNGPITISAGTVNARSGSTDKNFSGSGAAIGSGRGGRQVGDIVISGGVVNAVCMGRSAGIGGSANDNDGFAGGNITISGKYTKVTAVSVGGAGIGSGGRNVGVDSLNASGASGGNITIDDGTVIAVSTGAGAGIGGGNGGSGGSITINGGDVKAYGGNSEYKWKGEGSGSQGGTGISGIGDVIDGLMQDDFYDMISDVIIDALFSDTFSGAGIGGGSHAEGGTVVINGGIVEATAGTNEAKAIGYGRTNSDKGSLTLYENSKVTYGNYQGEKIEAEGVDQSETRHTYAQNNSYAKIEPGDLTVSFDVGEHGQAPEDQIVVRGETASEPDDPQADGYFFGGWYIDEGCTESYDFSAPVMKSITLHARWLKARAITIVKDWGGAEPADSVTITYDNEYSPGRSTSGTLQLSADNEWKGTITASDDSILTFGEEEVSGFRTGDYTLGEHIKLPSADKAGSARLVLRDQEDSGLSQEAFDEACSIVKSGSAVITLSNHRTRVYSVKKTWDLPQRQSDYKPESVKAVLQHGEGDSWKTVQTVTLSEKNGWSENFEPVDDDSREAFDGWRIRELDEDGKKVPDASDEDGSSESSARFHISPYTDTEFDMTYEVSYEEDTQNAVTEITNKAGTTYAVKILWEDFEGAEGTPDSVRVALENTDRPGSFSLLTLTEDDDWQGAFEGRANEGNFRVREMMSNGELVYMEGDEKPEYIQRPYNKAEFKVTKDGKSRTYEYDVSISVDEEKHLTTITNKKAGIIYSVKKEWIESDSSGGAASSGQKWANRIYAVDAVLQHRTTDENGDEIWENIGDLKSVSSDKSWKMTFDTVRLDKDFRDEDYRVREWIDHRFDDTQEGGFPTNWQTFTYFSDREGLSLRPGSDTLQGRLLLTEDDADNTSGLEPVFSARYKLDGTIGDVKYEDTSFKVSYERDKDGNFVIMNRQAGTMTVKKEWASSAEGVDPLRPESIRVVLQKKVGSAGETWQTVETAQLSEENDWKYEFNAVQYQADGTFDAEDFRIRELGEGTLLSDGDVILDPTDADYQQDEATAPVVEYEVTAGDKTEKIPYQVSYERKGDVTTITNTVSYLKAEKKWDIDIEGKDHPDSVEIIAQKKIGDKWETIGTAQLSDENEWKTNIPVAEKPGGDTQYRVRELKAKSAMESITEPLGITEAEKRIVYDKDDNDKPQSDEDDNTTNIVIYKVESYTSALTGEEKSHKTEYMVSYKEEDGTYTVTNKAIIGVDIVKNWFRAGDVDEEDMPDSVWLVLMCSPKAGALDNARDLAEAAGVDLSKVLDYEFPVINPIEGGKDPVSLIGELALGVDIGIFDKVSTVPKLAIAKAVKDEEDSKKNWRVHFVNSKYVSGIPMEYRGAELSSEALRQIVKYVTKIDLPVSYNPFDGYISIPTKASSSFDNWKITDLDLSKLKEAGGNLTQQDLDAVKSALGASDTNLAASVFNVKVDIDLDEDDDEQPDENTITGKVLWNDDDDRDGIRPDKVKVELLENGEVAASAETSEAAGWKFFFPDRPKQKDGKDIEYAITEDTTDVITGADGPGTYAFKVSGDYDDGFTVTNTHSPSTVDIRGEKTWEDADDQDGVRPQNIFIRLFADGREVDIQTVNAAKDWKWSFEGKPKYKDGKEIVYTIKEDEVEGYSSKVTGHDVTNTHEPEVTDVTVTKKWEDESDHDGRRPSSVTLQLRADGRIAAEHEVTAEDDWKWTFSDQPVYKKGEKINYTAGERDIEDYTGTVDGLTITNKYEIGKTQVNVYKEWADDNDRDGIRPESVKVCLLADGEDTGKTLTLDAAHSWAGTFSSLDEYAQGGRKIVYSVKEIPGDIPSGDEGYTSRITGSPEEGFIITNSHEPGTVDIKGGKTWEDDEDKAGQRPESIVIHLLANGSEADVRTVTEEDDWTWTFEGLPQREKGQDISYTINEDPVDGYESEVHGFDVTNTYIPMCTITYDLNGGAFEGSAENIIEKYRTGTTIAIHQAPERDGYEFTHWQGSSYQPGDEYKVTEDHIFTAQWEKKDTPPDDEDDPPGDDPEDDDPGDGPGDNPGGDAPSGGDPHHDSPGTGDRSDIILWIMVMITSLMSLLVAHALHRKSENN